NGSTTGTDYTTSFEVSVAQYARPTLYLPQFAQGPTQTVNVPSDTELTTQTLTGLPLEITAGAGAHSGSATRALYPNLLTLSNSATAVGADTITVVADNLLGSATISFTSAAGLPAGTVVIGTLNATVKDTFHSAYGAKELLHLHNALLDGSAAQTSA